MATYLLAQPSSDNAGGGALLTLWFPLGLFIIVAAVLWLIYSRPHGRVPPRPAAHAHGASSVAGGAGGTTSLSGAAQGPVAGPEASAEPAADGPDAPQPDNPPHPGTPPQPGSDDPGHQQ